VRKKNKLIEEHILEEEPENHALGRSRGGFSSKIHWVSDRNSVPLAATISAGEAHDSKFFISVMQKVNIPVKRGRPRNKPEEVVADKGYDAKHIRMYLRKRGIKAMIPEKAIREGARRRKKGPHHRFDKETYKERASIEQTIGWIKEYRRIATRYEKLAVSFWAMVKLAFARYYLKTYLSDTA
jgi:transposase